MSKGVVRALAGAVAGCAVLLSGGTAASAPSCALVPLLRDATVNQGVGSYGTLVRGKETIVRLYLSLPSCAASGSSITLTSASLRLVAPSQAGPWSPTPAIASTAPPPIATYSVAPLADGTGDPKFVVPGTALALGDGSAPFTATFAATIGYSAKTSSRATPVTGTINLPLSGAPPISATFAKKTNGLRTLVVPMGDASKGYSTQFTAAGQTEVQNGMTTLSRMYPVPAGTGELRGSATIGTRYSVDPTVLDLKALNLIDAAGKFCGTAGNYNLIKGQLAQFLLSWNTVNGAAPADRVLGVVDNTIANTTCATGMAVMGSNEAWARLSPGVAGGLFGLELGHTLGLVPRTREDPFDGGHSANTYAENPRANRRFNVFTRRFLTDDRSVMKPATSGWTNDNTLFESPDFLFGLCKFGGPTNNECTTPGTVGAVVGGNPVFVMSGTTDGTAAGTSIVESYFSTSVPRSDPEPTSAYKLVLKDLQGAQLGAPLGVPVLFSHSDHSPGGHTHATDKGLIAVAQPVTTFAETIELWKGAPGAQGSVLLYTRSRGDDPVVTSIRTTSGDASTCIEGCTPTGGGDGGTGTSDGTSAPAIVYSSNLDAADKLEDSDVYTMAADGTGRQRLTTGAFQKRNPQWSHDNTRIIFDAENDGPDIWTMDADGSNRAVVEATEFGASEYDPTWAATGAIAYTSAATGDADIEVLDSESDTTPTNVTDNEAEDTQAAFSPDGSKIAFSSNRGGGWRIWVMNADGTGTPTQLTTGTFAERTPAWSPDGTKIAFVREFPSVELPAASIYVANANGSGTPARVTTTLAWDRSPSFSPDGGKLVFSRSPNPDSTGAAEIYTVNVDGSGLTRITTNTDTDDLQPDWQNPVGGWSFAEEFEGALDGDTWGTTGNRFSGATWGGPYSVPTTTVTGGEALLAAGSRQTFHYLWSKDPMLPPSGDFVLEVRAKYDSLATHGDGFRARPWADPTPTGTNNPYGNAFDSGCGTFHIWGDTLGVRVWLAGNPHVYLASPTAYHTYRLEYVGGKYLLFVDGVLRVGPITSNRRPNRMWFGHPEIVGGPADWTDYRLDFVRVTQPLFVDGDNNGVGDGVQNWGAGAGLSTAARTDTDADGMPDSCDPEPGVANPPPSGPPPAPPPLPAPPAGKEMVRLALTDDNPGLITADIVLKCPSGDNFPVAVGLRPDAGSVTATTARITTLFDATLACPGGTLTAIASDGVTQSALGDGPVGVVATTSRPPKGSIYSPGGVSLGGAILQYGLIPLRGAGRSADDSELPDTSLSWTVSGPGISRAGTGSSVDLSPPSGGWPVGQYTAQLIVSEGSRTDVETVAFNVVGDADNDGMSTSTEALPCFTSGDTDPFNAFTDYDADGIPNVVDPAPCTAAASYDAWVDVLEEPLAAGATSFSVTVRVPYRHVAQVIPSSVKITRIQGQAVSLANVGWSVANGVGTAKFKRGDVLSHIGGRGLCNRKVEIAVAGASGAPQWSFEGFDTPTVNC